MNYLDEEINPKQKSCKCRQCKEKKKRTSRKVRKFFKRMLSKKRRKNKDYTHMWA
jgi:hypothetical protein